MILLITGATHTGKTRLAQNLLEKCQYPYVSIDHLKMGLIRSGMTDLTVEEDDELTAFLWPIVREMIKTAIENKQNLIVEGCYVPFDWKDGFGQSYLDEIHFLCLCFSEQYIETRFEDIVKYGSVIESRLADGYVTKELLKRENRKYLNGCISYKLPYLLIEEDYEREIAALF